MTTERPRHKHHTAIFGLTRLEGAWVVPRKLSVTVLMGGTKLDLRDIELPPGVTEFKVRCMAGGVAVMVPPGVAVETDGFALMGGFADRYRVSNEAAATSPDESDESDESDEGRPVLRLTGFTVLGGLNILVRPPSDSAAAKSKRRKSRRRSFGIRIGEPVDSMD